MLKRNLQVRRNRVKLEVNRTYADKQLAKRNDEIDNFIIKEGTTNANALAIIREHIENILRAKQLPLTPVIIRDLVRKYRDDALCDIKSHELVTDYYRIESLYKYCTHVNMR